MKSLDNNIIQFNIYYIIILCTLTVGTSYKPCKHVPIHIEDL